MRNSRLKIFQNFHHICLTPELHIESPLIISESKCFCWIFYYFCILSIVTEEDNLLSAVFELELDRLIEWTDNCIDIDSNHLPILDDEIIRDDDIWSIVVSECEPSLDKDRDT